MKRFVKKMLLLALLMVLTITALNRLGIKAGSIYKDGAALVCEAKRRMVRSGAMHYKKNKVNVLFMGTSRILAGIVPIHFDELTGGRTFSYNLGLPALPISSSYFVLKDYLEKNPPPHYIVIQLHINRCQECKWVNYYSSQGMRGWEEMFSLFKNMENKSIIIEYLFPFKRYKFHTFSYLFDSVFCPSAVRQLQEKNRAILSRMAADRGFYFIEEQALTENNRLPEELVQRRVGEVKKKSIYDPFIDPYVEKFFDLTSKNRVKVLLIQPAFRENQYARYENMPLQFNSILKRYNNVFSAKQGWKLKFYDHRFFSDPTHLNEEGAMRFTEDIYNEFIEVFPVF